LYRRIETGVRAIATFLVLCSLCSVGLGAAEQELDTLRISSDLRIRVVSGRDIVLEVLAAPEDDYESIAARVATSKEQAAAISACNGGAPLSQGSWIRVPMALLSGDYRILILRTLFPNDHRDGDDWIHVSRSGLLPIYDEGLWQVSVWFTGRGDAFDELMAENRLTSPELRDSQLIRIPSRLLHQAFSPGERSGDGELEFGSDSQGPYAGYRLKAGEALYSAVVGRFTGRTSADDVMAIAERLRKRSGIRDITDIPVGYMIKIPLELLEPQFLPAEHPRRKEAEAASEELALALARSPVGKVGGGLEGVVIILDPGHGGEDLGTINNGIWEHDYVYDVACRLKSKLEDRTSATVSMTLVDKKTGCTPSSSDKLVANRQGTIQTTPPFLPKKGEAKLGVNLRWYLANSLYRQALERGIEKDRVVFISLHADSRHPALRGVMVYVPGAQYRRKTYGFSSSAYKKYQEVREKQHVKFGKSDRLRSEALSRKYADAVIADFRKADLPVQPYQPVRNRIIRGKSVYVPAVLRGNAIPTKVLVEMVNLKNKEDASLLASAKRRDALAEALFKSLLRHFDDD
jgi:N-acetylmuramoyl-L-alanine amidase